MKINLLLFCLCLLLNLQSHGQWGQCQQGLIPNVGARGQTLTTTISGTEIFPGYGSAPCNPSDVFLYQSSTATTIYASSLTFLNDSAKVTWNIPANAPIGVYDLDLQVYGYSPFTSCSGFPTHCIRPMAFGIGVDVVTGTVYNDDNQDSIFNTIDTRLPNQRVLLLPDNVITLTNSSGLYSFFVDTGIHTVVILNDVYFNPVSSDSITFNVGTSNIDSLDFAMHTSGVFPVPNASLYGRARCNTNQTYSLSFYSNTVYPLDIVIKVFHTQNAPFVSSNLTPDSVVGDTIYYSATNVIYGYGSLGMQFQIPAAGSIILFTAVIEYYDAGTLVNQSIIDLNQTVTCSFDPNDKAVYPEGVQAEHYTLMDEVLYYTIRFQNTGNDTAYQVHIIDSLDTNLDMSTLQIMASSHPLIVEEHTNGIVDFIFHNIMLPDWIVDDPGSNGFVTYAIRHVDPLPDYTEITNTAYIYFDLNSPIQTNTTLNTMVFNIPVGIVDPVKQRDVTFYPNPFNESVTITNMDGKPFSHMLIITDIEGRELISKPLSTTHATIDLNSLSSGVYIYRLLNQKDGTVSIGKLIKH